MSCNFYSNCITQQDHYHCNHHHAMFLLALVPQTNQGHTSETIDIFSMPRCTSLESYTNQGHILVSMAGCILLMQTSWFLKRLLTNSNEYGSIPTAWAHYKFQRLWFSFNGLNQHFSFH